MTDTTIAQLESALDYARMEIKNLQHQVETLTRAVDAKSLYRQRPDFAAKGPNNGKAAIEALKAGE